MFDLSSPLPDKLVARILASDRSAVMRRVEEAYRLFAQGQAHEVAPSYLRPPHDPRARIIAKPACLYGERPVAGLKWIASFPGNVTHGLPRASGILLLNDMQTGLICGSMEVAAINAHRTAASAALALRCLHGPADPSEGIAVLGCGVIGWQIVEYLLHEGWAAKEWVLFDPDGARAVAFAERLRHLLPHAHVVMAASMVEAVSSSPIVVLATTAVEPELMEIALQPAQTLLHISLRDLGPDVMARAANLVDSADLAFTHQTSLHLTEQALGHRDYLVGDIGFVLKACRPADRPVIFSPFGMAILDLAVGQWVMARHQAEAA